MYRSILAFVMTSVVVSQSPIIFLNGPWLKVAFVLVLWGFKYQNIRPFISSVAAIIYVQYMGILQLDSWLPKALEGREMLVSGLITSLPKKTEHGFRFEFEIQDSDLGFIAEKVSLAWYEPSVIPKPGEIWKLVVKLKRPHAMVNSGLVNFETWLFSNAISATGYIRGHDQNRLLDESSQVIHQQIRQLLREKVEKLLPMDREQSLIIALLIGESAALNGDTWSILSNTGTNHLLIVSGLHVGLVAALIYFLIQHTLRYVTLHYRLYSVVLSLLLTSVYCLLVGMGLPVQRALIMVGVGLMSILLKRRISAVLSFLYALIFVLMLNPFASFSAGFWLSFGAVAALIFVFSGQLLVIETVKAKLVNGFKTQTVIFVAMSPLLIFWIGKVSLIGFLVNLIAIPFVALIIVPVLLLATPLVLADLSIGTELLQIVHFLLRIFMRILESASDLNWVYEQQQPSSSAYLLAIIFACIASLSLLVPKGIIPKWLSLILFLPLLLPQREALNIGEFSLTVLDVGQGLSVIVKTKNHSLVYDTGPKFGPNNDAGKRIVLPSLAMMGRYTVDKLIVSHGDMDHAGGVVSLDKGLSILETFAGEPSLIRAEMAARDCVDAEPWFLDGVKFEFIKPYITPLLKSGLKRNNLSCILLISADQFRVLLPGDIESLLEAQLIGELQGINLLLAPHHGSLSSSSPSFLNQLMPELVIISAGYQNKFNHPNPRVLARYENRGARVLSTFNTGAITVSYQENKVGIETARGLRQHFWYDH